MTHNNDYNHHRGDNDKHNNNGSSHSVVDSSSLVSGKYYIDTLDKFV